MSQRQRSTTLDAPPCCIVPTTLVVSSVAALRIHLANTRRFKIQSRQLLSMERKLTIIGNIGWKSSREIYPFLLPSDGPRGDREIRPRAERRGESWKYDGREMSKRYENAQRRRKI